MSKLKILIADDHPIFRRGLCDVLMAEGGYTEIFEAGDGNQAVEIIHKEQIDVAILDISMPRLNGLDVLVKARHWSRKPIFVILTMYDNEAYLRKALEYGALGYILKDNAESELLSCLKMVAGNKHYFSPGVSWMLVNNNLKGTDFSGKLSSTEQQIMNLVGEFKTSAEIASLLSVSVRTVQNHRANICKKLGLSGANALSKYATEVIANRN